MLALALLVACRSRGGTPAESIDDSAPPDDSGEPNDSGDEGCDAATRYFGSGDAVVEVEEPALFCALGAVTIDDLRALRRASFTPGTYAIPDEPMNVEYRLPVCVERPDVVATLADTGSLLFASGGAKRTIRYEQPLAFGTDEQSLVVEFEVRGDDLDLEIDELRYRETASGSVSQSYAVCHPEGGCVALTPCATPQKGTTPTERWTFPRGSFTAYIDAVSDGMVSVDRPRVFYKAEAELDGTSIVQTDFFKLGHALSGHGVYRDYIVLFDTPVGKACGIEGHVDKGVGEVVTLVTIDCEGNELEDLGPVKVSWAS